MMQQKLLELTDDLFEVEKIMAMAAGYIEHYDEWLSEIQLEAVEKHVETKLVNLDTGGTLKKFRLHGYIDKFVTHNGKRLIVDHKTTGEDISDPGGRYWKRLECDPQSTTYLLLCLSEGYDVGGIVWDVVQKPRIKPTTLNRAQVLELEVERTYCDSFFGGTDLFLDELAPPCGTYANGEPKREESPLLYGARVRKYVREHAKEMFQIRKINRTDEDVYDLNQSVRSVSRMIRWCELNGEWAQNLRSCFAYNHPCEYFDVCHGCELLESPSFVKVERDRWRLSHSAIGDFFTCPRKYYHRQICGYRPVTVESEALRTGSLWHAAMDCIYRELVEPHEGGCDEPIERKDQDPEEAGNVLSARPAGDWEDGAGSAVPGPALCD